MYNVKSSENNDDKEYSEWMCNQKRNETNACKEYSETDHTYSKNIIAYT